MSNPRTVFVAVNPKDLRDAHNTFCMSASAWKIAGITDLSDACLADWEDDAAAIGLQQMLVALLARKQLTDVSGYEFGKTHTGANPGIEITFHDARDAMVWKLANGGAC